MYDNTRTIGESYFEEYLVSQSLTGFEFEKTIQVSESNLTILSIQTTKSICLTLTDFDPTDIPPSGSYDPYRRIRKKINDGREKFKEYTGLPCCIVFYNNNAPLVDLTRPEFMIGAMEGDYGFTFKIDLEKGLIGPNSVKPAFLDRGKMIRPHWSKPQNTSISALITLRHVRIGYARYRKHILKKVQKISFEEAFTTDMDFDREEKHLGVIVWENRFATVEFPRNLFCGPYDERYGLDGDNITRVFAGNGIIAYEALNAS